MKMVAYYLKEVTLILVLLSLILPVDCLTINSNASGWSTWHWLSSPSSLSEVQYISNYNADMNQASVRVETNGLISYIRLDYDDATFIEWDGGGSGTLYSQTI
jgi:hypothetical protein